MNQLESNPIVRIEEMDGQTDGQTKIRMEQIDFAIEKKAMVSCVRFILLNSIETITTNLNQLQIQLDSEGREDLYGGYS